MKNIKSKFKEKFIKKLNPLRRKTPKSNSYPFMLCDPNEVCGDRKHLESFYFVGENWSSSDKPIAVMWGFNDWKLGFIADYLPEYRVLFVPRKMGQSRAILKLSRAKILNPNKDVFIVWGFNELYSVKLYSKKTNIKTFRMEDGFIRSADLGSAHTVPYSLVLDKTGFYYDCHQPSDVENLLNNYIGSSSELETAESLLKKFVDSNLSKYNLPSSSTEKITDKIKTKKRVLVIGQVDSDQSIKRGNPKNINSEELVKIAREENPSADVIYRPHPDVFLGYQKSRIRKKSIEEYARLVSPNEPFISSLESVDHVYTISSLSGIEAVLRGIKVTTLGAPFYSGWGLTDDRVEISRRNRNLNLVEFFNIAYILYPKYLGCLNNSSIGLQAALCKIKLDRMMLLKSDRFTGDKSYSQENIASIFSSGIVDKSQIASVNYSEIFKKNDFDCKYQTYISLYMLGYLSSIDCKKYFLEKTRKYYNDQAINEILSSLNLLGYAELVDENLLWALNGRNQNSQVLSILKKIDSDNVEYSVCADESQSKDLLIFKSSLDLGDEELIDSYAKKLLLTGTSSDFVIYSLMRHLESKFRFNSSRKLSLFLQTKNLLSFNRNVILSELRSLKFLDKLGSQYIEDTLVKSAFLKPDKILQVFEVLDLLEMGGEEGFDEVLKAILYLDNDFTNRKVQAFISIEDFDRAHYVAKGCLSLSNDNTTSDYVGYCQTLSYIGRIEEAKQLMEYDISREQNSENITELLRLCVLSDDYNRSISLIEEAKEKQIFIGDMHRRKAYFGIRDINTALVTFRENPLINKFKSYYSEKSIFVEENFDIKSIKDDVFIMSIFGPGDEVRFSSIYEKIEKDLGDVVLNIACSPKLTPLLSRSFPKINFVDVPRPRVSQRLDLGEYDLLPNLDFTTIANNLAIEHAQKCTNLIFVLDLLGYYLKDYGSFSGCDYLVPDAKKICDFRNRLNNISDKVYVGISWRSSLTTHSRNEHYLKIQELSPLFEIDNIQFVNFQYDECADELDWVERNYPGKIVHFDDVDHYDDFDSVASLLKCMDLVISPATTVVELAGAIGCKTWLFSNSSELNWRKKNDHNFDVWHNSIEIVEGDILGDKLSLVSKVKTKLVDFVEKQNELKSKKTQLEVI
ncbi:hypothetical protein A1OW_09880 [Enterovibrio norvegicus]|uniref:capsular polysaccharide export protein, LipB/KpsS family n=1 Tax=Enterovibrio norvegicus TaxID=188144 RepID=UPI0002F6A871|nr:beta-3-deoxy-D-manno-oct-2-ulosonic acid transferase [Enterovibrio norvegicus]OEF51348.1 hypothetical protein A1OW_09880 [Enterovibrio norvegicus]